MVSSRLLNDAHADGLPELCEEVLSYTSAVSCASFNLLGSLLATGCEDGRVLVWDSQTRAVVREYETHSDRVTSVSWDAAGRRLTSTGRDGRVAVRCLPSGALAFDPVDLGRGPVTCAAWERAREDPSRCRVVVSFEPPHAPCLVEVSLTKASPRPGERSVPCAARALPAPLLISLQGEAKSLLRLDAAAPWEGGSAALLSGGRLVLVAARGTVSLLRSSDGAVVDCLRLSANARATRLEVHPDGLSAAIVASDRLLRVVQIEGDVDGEDASLSPLEEASFTAPLAAWSTTRSRRGRLRLFRRFEQPAEQSPWSAAAFSACGRVLAGGVAQQGAHVVYLWDLASGATLRVLEGAAGAGAPRALSWHPRAAPMQLLTVGVESGDAYLWARVFEDAWTAFAPDFEEIDENREYVEREDEFDLPGVLERGAVLCLEGSSAGNGQGAREGDSRTSQDQPFLDLMTPLAGAEEDDRGYTDAFARDVLGLDVALLRGLVPSDPDEDPRPLLCFPLRCRPREGALDGTEARGDGEEEGSQGGEEVLHESVSQGGESGAEDEDGQDAGMEDDGDEQDAGMEDDGDEQGAGRENEALPQPEEILPDLHDGGEEAMAEDPAFVPAPRGPDRGMTSALAGSTALQHT